MHLLICAGKVKPPRIQFSKLPPIYLAYIFGLCLGGTPHTASSSSTSIWPPSFPPRFVGRERYTTTTTRSIVLQLYFKQQLNYILPLVVVAVCSFFHISNFCYSSALSPPPPPPPPLERPCDIFQIENFLISFPPEKVPPYSRAYLA